MSTMEMSGSYNYWLVALSVVLALVSAYAALDLAGRIASAHGRTRAMWLGFGAAAMGTGIWSMHYVGMLALSMAVPVFYDVPMVVASLLAAIGAALVALFVVSRPQLGPTQMVVGSLVMGSGIASMHYLGMAAMRGDCVITYNLAIVGLSIVLAVGISAAALQLSFRAREDEPHSARRNASAIVMGLAIPLMHYTGMWAATFHESRHALDLRFSLGTSTLGVAAIGSTSLLVLAIAIASSFFDRYFASQRNDLIAVREREIYFHTMAEALPEMIWTCNPPGDIDYVNQRTLDYYGMTFEEIQRGDWVASIHPEDVVDCESKWQAALASGQPFDAEYRIRSREGAFRWFLARANPIRDRNEKILKWFGTVTDVENQKQSQQTLEAQVVERTTQLADVNARLQEEMFERDFARSALDQQNAKMMQDLEERSKRATLLAKMGEHLQSCISRDEVFAAALGFAPRIFPTARGSLALMNSARNHVEVIGSWLDCLLPAPEFEPTKCWALRTGQPHLVPAGDPTARCAHALGVEHTYLCVPILAQGETLGILHLQATDEAPQLNAAELSFKTTFAGQVGLSIANIKLREALRTQSVRDALTGLYNRRYLEEVLDREIRRAGRCEQSMGVLMIDLDHFKQFNDTYGHDAGDTVLREAASFLVKNVRTEDFVCRYGGEEFVIILPTADINNARARGERLRSKIKETQIVYQGQTLRMVTFSVGVAEFPRNGTTPQELMAAADAALYEAKRAGRDQVVVSKSEPLAQEPEKSTAAASQ